MFRRTSPQTSLMESQFLLPEKKRRRLEESWAHDFRTRVLPLIDEEAFRDAFDPVNGRPNKSIRLLVGLHLLKEAEDLTDEQVLDALRFNLQWQYALAVEAADADTCQKTLHNFRAILLASDRGRSLFVGLTEALAKLDGLYTFRQRLDSTHVISDIATLTRLGLFVETIAVFLRELRREAPDRLAGLSPGYAARYLDDTSFPDVRREEARRRLPEVAKDLFALVGRFEADETVRELESYRLLVRLLGEQCVVTPAAPEGVASGGDGPEGPPASDAPASAGVSEVSVKPGKEIQGSSLQTPHDPDATYGHKGKGYELQVAETCHPDNAYDVITHVSVTSSSGSDQNATMEVLDTLACTELTPTEMLADTGFGSGENIVSAAELGVDLIAPVQDPAHGRSIRAFEPVEPPEQAQPAPATEPADVAEPVQSANGSVPAVVGTDAGASPASSDVRTGAARENDAAELNLSDFSFNGTFNRVERCPAGQAPVEQVANDLRNTATFDPTACESCPFADRCPTRSTKEGRKLQWTDAKAATAHRQREQQTPAFKDNYRSRGGIESTNSELKRRHGAGRLRVRGLGRVELAEHLKAAALNVKRAVRHHEQRRRMERLAAETTSAHA